jgi:hypothetical protein
MTTNEVTTHLIDRRKIDAALVGERSRVAAFPGALSLERYQALFAEAPETYEQMFDELEPDTDYAYAFSQVSVAHAALAGSRSDTVVEETLSLEPSYEPTALYFGNLHVRGDLEYDRNIIVFGDLTVDGVITHEGEHSVLLVAGSLRCKGADLHGATWVGGRAEMDVLCLSRYGYLYGHEGIAAELVIRNAYEAGVRSAFKASHWIDLIDARFETDQERLREISSRLEPAAMAGCDEFWSPSALVDLLRAGKPYLREEHRNVAAIAHPPTPG